MPRKSDSNESSFDAARNLDQVLSPPKCIHAMGAPLQVPCLDLTGAGNTVVAEQRSIKAGVAPRDRARAAGQELPSSGQE